MWYDEENEKEVPGMEVTLPQMLEAREKRAERQKALIREFGKPIVCFKLTTFCFSRNFGVFIRIVL